MQSSRVVVTCFALLAVTVALSIEDPVTRCTESCLKIHPDTHLTSPVRHCAKLTPDGKCECDWEKILTPSGTCECLNPYHSVNDANHCVCDLKKCPPHDLMTYCKVKETQNGCCKEYICEECPEDSYRNNQTQGNKCLCYPCKAPDCKNQSMIIKRQGNLKPGTCCDLYECEEEKRSCIVENKSHPDGETWLEGCKQFSCNDGIVFHKLLEDCQKKFCLSNDQIYQNFQTWLEDECTNCTCVDGVKKCMAHFCKELPSATTKPLVEDCPSLMDCKKDCPFGLKVNRKGCEMCKCRQPDVKTMQDILKELNCTAESCDVMRAPSMCAEKKDTDVEQCPKCIDSPSPSNLWPAILLTSTATLSLVCLALLYLLWRERRRTLCTLHGTPTTHATEKYLNMFDDNLNQDNKAMLLSASKAEVKDFR